MPLAAGAQAFDGDWEEPGGTPRGSVLRFEAAYTGELVSNRAGGARQHSDALGMLELRLRLNAQAALGWPGTTVFVHGLRTHGADPGDFVGDAQGISNIAAPARTRLHEAWIQKNDPERGISLLAGRYDLNSEFYQLQSADLFLHSSFGIGPEFSQTGQGGPSIFPDTAIGGRLELRPHPSVVLRAAALNGVPVSVRRADGATGLSRAGDGLLLAGEASLRLPGLRPLEGGEAQQRARRRRIGRAAVDVERDLKLAIGGWRYTGRFEDLARVDASGAPSVRQGSQGLYAIGEYVLWRDPRTPGRRARVFAQLGRGDPNVARFGGYTGAGFTFVGLFRGRIDDEIGLAFASARAGPGFREREQLEGRSASGSETAFELTYLAQLTPRLSVQPTLQFVRNPGTDPALRGARIALLRLEIVY